MKEFLVNEYPQKGDNMKKLIDILPLVLIPLSMQSSDAWKTAQLGTTYEAIIYNNSNSPVIVWPIPTYAPPRVLSMVPNKREGIETAPAKLGWPSLPKSVVVVADPLVEDFNKMLDDMFAEAAKGNPDDYDWTGETSRRLEAKPKTEWVMLGHGDSKIWSSSLETYVIYNIGWKESYREGSVKGHLWARTAPGDNHTMMQVYPYYGYKGVSSK